MALDPNTPFVWGDGGAQLTPDQIASRRRLAQEMIAQGTSYSPIASPWQGAARVAQALLGGYDDAQAEKQDAQARKDAVAQVAALLGGNAAAASPASAARAMPGPPSLPLPAQAAGPADTSNRILEADEPSPLDPPSGADRDLAIRTIIAEAGDQPTAGQTAVAAVLRNRAASGRYGGNTLEGVIRKPYAFEPWNTPEGRAKMAAIAETDPRYIAAGKALDAAYFGEDPTGGATHFVAPKAQAALGRQMPAWASGAGTAIGDHVFYSPDRQPTAPTLQSAPQATAPTSPAIADVARVLANPYTPAPLATMLAAQLKPREQHVQETDAAGNVWDINKLTGQRTVVLKADKPEAAPQSVREYEYYTKNFKPTEGRPEPMSYDTWATAKARAGAINVGNVTTNAGGTDKQIFDSIEERWKTARSAAEGLVGLRNARQALDGAGGVITGAGADNRLALQKIGNYLGVTDPAAIENTETFRAAIAPQVAAVLKATVGTSQISNTDRAFAEKAAGGSIELNAGSIRRLLDIMEKASVAKLQEYDEQLNAIYPDPVANKRERALFTVRVPQSGAVPAGATKSGIKWSVE
uniref:Cell wall hydrolase SleB n=1 Tax=Rhodopseudomonas palustris (strain DX-1) TaxID=652103 RepID=E6VFN0_RHOPX